MAHARFIRWVLILSIGGYVALRVGIASWAEFVTRTQDTRTSNRLLNVHMIPRESIVPAVERYIERMPQDTGRVVCVGDSQTYGHGLPPDQTFAACLDRSPQVRRAGLSVHNLSIINGPFRDNTEILRRMAAQGKQPSWVLISSNPTHFQDAVTRPAEEDGVIPRHEKSRSLFASMLLTRQNVFDLVEMSLRRWRKLHPVDLFNEVPSGSDEFRLLPVGPGYCAGLHPEGMLPDLIALIRAAHGMGAKVLFFTKPRFYDDYLKPPYNYDWKPEAVDEAVLAAARREKCAVVLDLAHSLQREHFRDLIHLSSRGHAALAELLQPHLVAADQGKGG